MGPPTGQYRVHSVQIYDKDKEDYVPLDLNKTYKIAGNDYMLANYGNGYEMFKGSTRYAYDNVLIYQSLSKYLAAFKTDASSNANLPVISTANNPINDEKGYINYKIDYENPDGAKRITISPYTPEPDPKPTPTDDTTNGDEQLSATSASTGDQAYIQAVLLMIILSTLILVGKSKRMMNNTRNYPQDY